MSPEMRDLDPALASLSYGQLLRFYQDCAQSDLRECGRREARRLAAQLRAVEREIQRRQAAGETHEPMTLKLGDAVAIVTVRL